jgi:hypothetical protein
MYFSEVNLLRTTLFLIGRFVQASAGLADGEKDQGAAATTKAPEEVAEREVHASALHTPSLFQVEAILPVFFLVICSALFSSQRRRYFLTSPCCC